MSSDNISLRQVMERSGHHLNFIADRLADVECVISDFLKLKNSDRFDGVGRFQDLDLINQELRAISGIMIELSVNVSNSPIDGLQGLIEGHRLESLVSALADGERSSAVPIIALFENYDA